MTSRLNSSVTYVWSLSIPICAKFAHVIFLSNSSSVYVANVPLNDRPVSVKKHRHLFGTQPHRFVFKFDINAGVAVGRLVEDDFASCGSTGGKIFREPLASLSSFAVRQNRIPSFALTLSSVFRGSKNLFPVRVALSRFETFSAYVRALLGAVAGKGAKRRTAGPLRPLL